jgi:hypothetical protein
MGVGRSGMGLYHRVGIWSWGKKIFFTDMVFLRTVARSGPKRVKASRLPDSVRVDEKNRWQRTSGFPMSERARKHAAAGTGSGSLQRASRNRAA